MRPNKNFRRAVINIMFALTLMVTGRAFNKIIRDLLNFTGIEIKIKIKESGKTFPGYKPRATKEMNMNTFIKIGAQLICCCLLLIVLAANDCYCAPVKITQLNAQLTSIALPLPGNPQTGQFTVTLSEATVPPGYINCEDLNGSLVWPARVHCWLLDSLSLPPLECTLFGPCIFSPTDSNSIYAFDMGYTIIPLVGGVFLTNTNNNYKFPAIMALCRNGGSVTGSFQDLSDEEFYSVVQPWLRAAMDSALYSLRQFDPTVPELSSAVLDSIFHFYENNRHTEFVFYFRETGEYRSSELTGTDAIANSNPIPTLTQWGMIIMGLLIIAISTAAVVRRRKLALRENMG